MEAMCAGLPCIVSDVRGNNDLIDEGKGGFLANPYNSKDFADAISRLTSDKELSFSMGEYNKAKIKEFDIDVVRKEILDIYQKVLL